MTEKILNFNGKCFDCKKFKPRCNKVYLRVPAKEGKADPFRAKPVKLCDDCRRSTFRGKFANAFAS